MRIAQPEVYDDLISLLL